jgi:hypothetical protein
MTELLFGAATAALPLLQSRQQHVDEVRLSNALHERAIAQARDLHDEALSRAHELHREALVRGHELHGDALAAARVLHEAATTHADRLHLDAKDLSLRLHIEQLQQELMHHKQQMTHATETARRENMRDVWEQKARKSETLLITNTLMFGCFFAVLVEGVLPPDVDQVTLVVYAAALGVSFAFLFLCMWFTMKNQSRMSSFNIYNVEQHYTCGRAHHSFESYYNCHCAALARLAAQSFYIGAVALVIAACCFTFARFATTQHSLGAALIFVCIAAATLLLVSGLHFWFPATTRAAASPVARNRRADAFSSSLQSHMRRKHAADIDPATTYAGAASLPPVDLIGRFTQSHMSQVFRKEQEDQQQQQQEEQDDDDDTGSYADE